MTEVEKNISETPEVTPDNEQALKTYTEEELKKEIQSAKSSAKFEILSSLGINSVEEFKTTNAAKDTKMNELQSDLNSKLTELQETKVKLDAKTNEFEQFKKNSVAKSLGVSDEQMGDFLTLVNAKVDADHSFDDVAKDIANKYFKPNEPFKMAVPNTNQAPPSPQYKTYGW